MKRRVLPAVDRRRQEMQLQQTQQAKDLRRGSAPSNASPAPAGAIMSTTDQGGEVLAAAAGSASAPSSQMNSSFSLVDESDRVAQLQKELTAKTAAHEVAEQRITQLTKSMEAVQATAESLRGQLTRSEHRIQQLNRQLNNVKAPKPSTYTVPESDML